MTPDYKTLHKNFRLNGRHYSWQELKDFSYSFVKEGDAYERSIGRFLQDWLDGSTTISVKTSGSTGEPRQISLKKGHMVNSALATGGVLWTRGRKYSPPVPIGKSYRGKDDVGAGNGIGP